MAREVTLNEPTTQDGVPGRFMMIRNEPRFIPDTDNPGEDTSAGEAFLVSAGRAASEILPRAQAVFGGEEARERLATNEQLFASLNEAHPVTTALGAALPGLAVPGGKVVQVGIGAIEGALADPDNPFTGAATGAAAGFVGQKVGEQIGGLVQSSIRQLSQSAAKRATQDALGTLNRIEPNPLRQTSTIGERGRGSLNTAPARLAERASTTARGGSAIASRRQVNLNKQFANAIGEPGEDALTGPVLGNASKRIGEVYERAADQVPSIPITQSYSDALGALAKEAADDPGIPARALKQLDILENLTLGDAMTGAIHKTTRTKLGKISRQLWNEGDDISAEWVDDLITAMDDNFLEAAPAGLADEVAEAGQQWRVLTAARRGAALDPSGNVNPNSMQNQLEGSFRTLDRANFAPGAIGDAQRANVAAQAFPPEASSRTAERIASSNPLTQARAAILSSGGGAAAQTGGAAARGATSRPQTPTEEREQ